MPHSQDYTNLDNPSRQSFCAFCYTCDVQDNAHLDLVNKESFLYESQLTTCERARAFLDSKKQKEFKAGSSFSSKERGELLKEIMAT